ncbi:AAA family ATPase [Variovorax sp.]|jgi:predicted ATPase|uniref:AAA family ATPase n=1 Tax=Variovorax sp. TaxID=1871043 RepID=UPI00121036A0|nr:AAA family ATPase [Variovorax sp.]TAJ65341.1 MAG: hypothetical protein EPO53_10020 [Variovorax sp.]
MRLASFQITHFRSINDSGPIELSRITTILGRNDTGKSNLLRALHSLNPAEGPVSALSPIKNFPRHRRLSECTADTPVVHTRWRLEPQEQAELVRMLPRASGVSHVTAGRGYGPARWAGLEGLGDLSIDVGDAKGKIRKIVPAVKAAAEKLADELRAPLEQAADAFDGAMILNPDLLKWSEGAQLALAALRQALAAAGAELADKPAQMVTELEELSLSIVSDGPALARAKAWILERLPRFVFVDEYPALQGRQNIADYLSSEARDHLSSAQRSFGTLCRAAGLDPRELHALHERGDQATRNQLVNRAGAAMTAEIRRLWKDRPLKVRFNLDGDEFDTLVSDPGGAYEVEVGLDERSRGFQWFFAFHVAFFAGLRGEAGEQGDGGIVLLLDEPGLHLHPRSQADLLAHFEQDFAQQIVYTTHSPFMVPAGEKASVRIAQLEGGAGTTLSSRELAAIGGNARIGALFDLAQEPPAAAASAAAVTVTAEPAVAAAAA